MGDTEIKPSVEVVVCASMNNNNSANNHTLPTDITKPSQLPILTRLHAGYFFICLSFGAQALLWKSLSKHNKDSQSLWHGFNLMPSIAFLLLWCVSLLTASMWLCGLIMSPLHFFRVGWDNETDILVACPSFPCFCLDFLCWKCHLLLVKPLWVLLF